jgi:hypothetical protein
VLAGPLAGRVLSGGRRPASGPANVAVDVKSRSVGQREWRGTVLASPLTSPLLGDEVAL